MTDWVPLDEKELLQEDDNKAYHDNASPQEQQAPRGEPFSDPPGEAPTGRNNSGREVTREMILRALERQRQGAWRRGSGGPTSEDPHAEDRFLAAQSHLHLNGLHIGRIANLKPLTTLEVLYLYDNHIRVIEGLSHLRRLTHLYLSNNDISQLSGLAGLGCLQKLYIEQNCLQVISGLESCPSLEELHVSSQRLPPGTSLTFHPASITALAPTLRILTAAHCAISSAAVRGLAGLYRLRKLDLSYNAVDAFEPLDAVVGPAGQLGSLDLRGNPVCRLPKYRDTVILMNDSVTSLDDEPVTAQNREFLLRLHIRRMKAQMAAEAKEDAVATTSATAATTASGASGSCGRTSGCGTAAAAAAPSTSGMGMSGHGYGGGDAYGNNGNNSSSGHGVSGAPSRVPPRTGGFHPPAPG
ncbi:hypothetical protein Agub_g12563, partial [Astrephomene gubernaculifera]